MNHFELLGRLTNEPQRNNQMINFTIAVERGKDQNGNKQTDFPRITVFGKTADVIERYLHKGKRVAVEGNIRTGSYQDKTGRTVYTTDLIAFKVDIIDWDNQQSNQQTGYQNNYQGYQQNQYTPPNFDDIDGNVPY